MPEPIVCLDCKQAAIADLCPSCYYARREKQPEPMSAERLAEIERRHAEHCGERCCQGETTKGCTDPDCLTFALLAEVRRLTEDRDRWKAACAYHDRDVIGLTTH